ncbi:MAG: hypothetical protein KatS3mg031_2373 [Chitinophagales bacterium]|nr:MAG: hypothetical protein KatS3mg031_2373 [Chitinophagales bacterium]
MKLSVIIVSYNVRYFLEQCLLSVRRAARDAEVEVIVVDNASADGSPEMVKRRFPEVKVIENTVNRGFSAANNQAITIARGKYVLLLNPDTLLQEDTLEKTLQFMDAHPEAGALGVKMVDGRGCFLPESKRALPTPKVAFFKMTGLSTLFPRSKTFSRYHLGYLDENAIHPVEVLSGAFMLIRKKVLDEIGLLDETFFMYGEDIDLSYRILKAGYKNYYFPLTTIVHYKGESTKKNSLRYVRTFYEAMLIFERKHFASQMVAGYSLLVHIAVYLTATASSLKRLLQKLLLPVADAALLYGGLYAIKIFWASSIKNAPEYYPPEYTLFVIPAYIFLWLVFVYLSGGYDKPVKNFRVIRGVALGTLAITVLYAFLPETLRFSRAMIILGAIWAVIALVSLRLVFTKIMGGWLGIQSPKSNRLIIAGSKEEAERALTLLPQINTHYSYLGYVTPQPEVNNESLHYLGTLDELPVIRRIYKADEVIFCSRDVSVNRIIRYMTENGSELSYKIIPEGSASIIGSNSKDTAGDLYAIDMNLAITSSASRRNKRLLDLIFCFACAAVFPLMLFVVNDRRGFMRNWLQVLKGTKSWVGYASVSPTEPNYILPPQKPGVLSPAVLTEDLEVKEKVLHSLNFFYAREYSIYNDLEILLRGIRYLGN